MTELEAATVDLIKRGDASVARSLFELLDPVFRTTVKHEFRLADREYSHNALVSELHFHVWDRLAAYDSERSLETWARKVAKRYVRDKNDYLMAKKRRPPGGVASLDAPSDNSMADRGSNLVAFLVDQLPPPDKLVSRQERLAEVRAMIAAGLMTLDEDSRIAVEMRYFDGATIKEIAETIGKTEKATEGLLRRARLKLRAFVGKASRFFSSR